jgi:hypothetical protein
MLRSAGQARGRVGRRTGGTATFAAPPPDALRRIAGSRRGVVRVKRTLVVVGLSASILAGGAGAAQAQTERSAKSFTLTSQTCPRLPAGTTVKGTGRETSVTHTSTDPATGLVTVVNYTKTVGTARDNKGGKYRFDYRNSFHVQNSAAAPATYVGTMFDLFALTGRGPSTIRNGFTAIFTTDLGTTASFQRLLAWGDPISFPDGAAHCDPL